MKLFAQHVEQPRHPKPLNAPLLAVYFEVESLHKKAGGRLNLPVTDGKNTMYSRLDWSNCPEVGELKARSVVHGFLRELGCR